MTRDDFKTITAWSLYDWANSAFATLVVTFVYAAYFTQAIAPDEVTGTVLWSRAVAVSGVAVAILSPILGVLADRGATRHRYLLLFTVVCIVATAGLAFVSPSYAYAVLLSLALFVLANVAFEMGMVFYNAYLPDITSTASIGRVSGYGWALGYAGGLVCLGVALAVLVRDPPLFGVPTADGFNYRATNLLVAAWFGLFSIPALVVLGRIGKTPGERIGVSQALLALRQTLGEVRRYRETAKLLLARLVYNDGLVTIFAFGGIYAAGTFGMTLAEVIEFGIVLNVAAGAGAWAFGFVDDRIGGKRTILITLVGLIGCTLLAAMAPSRFWLWTAGVGIGLLVGPNQSASRSLMGRFVPAQRRSEFFGFFAFSGKLTAFAGPLVLGIITDVFDNQRAGVATIVLFFLAGAALLLTVDEDRGVAAAEEAHASGK